MPNYYEMNETEKSLLAPALTMQCMYHDYFNNFAVLSDSFKPAQGVVHSVTIYPSDFGLQRMQQEDKHVCRDQLGFINDFSFILERILLFAW